MKFKWAYLLGACFAAGAYAQFGGMGAVNVSIPVVSISSYSATQFPPSSVSFKRGFELHISTNMGAAVYVSTASNVCNQTSCDLNLGMALLSSYPASFNKSDGTPLYFYTAAGDAKKLSGVVYK